MAGGGTSGPILTLSDMGGRNCAPSSLQRARLRVLQSWTSTVFVLVRAQGPRCRCAILGSARSVPCRVGVWTK
jgi:hypothetical protein